MKKLFSLAFLLLAILLALSACRRQEEYAPLQELYVEVEVEAHPHNDGTVTFVVRTNLPENTSLMLTLRGDDGSSRQGSVTIDGRGFAVSSIFGARDNPIHGSHTLTVSMSMARLQDETVSNIIGGQGEALIGGLVQISQFDERTVRAVFEFYFE